MIAWGGYDRSKPRVRLLLDALRRRDALADEISISVWDDVQDKSVAGIWRWARSALGLLIGWPVAMWRLMRSDKSLHILLPYPGTPDIFLAAFLARIQGRKLVLDAFLPIHDTIVGDRQMVRPGGLISRLIRRYEQWGLRLADIILTDTDQHAEFFADEFDIEPSRFITVMVGAESLFDPRLEQASVDDLVGSPDGRRIVLFYGQLIPLHGLRTILEAATATLGDNIHWVIVGKGQQEPVLRDFLAGDEGSGITWIPWVEYERLPSLIARADVCLGVFGASDKAGRVIPNKMFQILAMGKPIITRSSAAVDSLADRFPDQIQTVPAEDPDALGKAVLKAVEGRDGADSGSIQLIGALTPDAGVAQLIARLSAS